MARSPLAYGIGEGTAVGQLQGDGLHFDVGLRRVQIESPAGARNRHFPGDGGVPWHVRQQPFGNGFRHQAVGARGVDGDHVAFAALHEF